jgi:DNA-binding response OmpR family regulator
VLIADDNRDAADTLALLVGLWGHDVRQVYDGTAAIDMASVYHPDVCMLDIAMPGLDGSQVARQLRVLTGFGNLLLLAITGWTDEVHRLCSMKAGFEYYLIKPVEPLIIENLLLAHLAGMASPPGILPALLWRKSMPIVNRAVPYEYRGVIAGRDREAIGSGST